MHWAIEDFWYKIMIKAQWWIYKSTIDKWEDGRQMKYQLSILLSDTTHL